MSNVSDINDEAEFDKVIASGVSVVELWAPWCGPCKMQAPTYEQVADESVQKGENAKFYKSNIDECGTIASRFKIGSIPCILLFKDGKEVETLIGSQRKKAIADAVSKVLAPETAG